MIKKAQIFFACGEQGLLTVLLPVLRIKHHFEPFCFPQIDSVFNKTNSNKLKTSNTFYVWRPFSFVASWEPSHEMPPEAPTRTSFHMEGALAPMIRAPGSGLMVLALLLRGAALPWEELHWLTTRIPPVMRYN